MAKSKNSAANSSNNEVDTLKLRNPITIDGQTIEVLTLDFNSLTGQDLEEIEAEMGTLGKNLGTMPELSKAYLMQIVARAAKININHLRMLNARDVTKATMLAQVFLMG